MFSMTGYGKGEYRADGVELTVELKSVNNRFLDLGVKCPRIFMPYEELIRAVIREHISRGHVDVFVSFTDKRETGKSFYVDTGAAKAYFEAAKEIKAAVPSLTDDTSLSLFLKLPDVVRPEEKEGADETLINALKTALLSAIEGLKKMRLAEGNRLKQDLLARMDTIKDLREKIAVRAPKVAEEYRKKLTERMEEYL
ncbi:MAG: hypothetical protein K2N74_00470, partial [Clostridiales bacterium]|nr:hypothetical protein [Clostridiales bacterium]